MLDLPDMDAAMPPKPFPSALVQPWAATAQPLTSSDLSGVLLHQASVSEATPEQPTHMLSWLSHAAAQRSPLTAVLSPISEPAVVTPLSLATLLKPMMAFAQPKTPPNDIAAIPVLQHAIESDESEGAESKVTLTPVSTRSEFGLADRELNSLASTEPEAVEPGLTIESGLENWAAIADIRVVSANEDLLSPTLTKLAACTVTPAKPTDPSQSETPRHQVWLQTHHIADFETLAQAEAMAQQLRRWHQAGLTGDNVRPRLQGGRPWVEIDRDTVLAITPAMAESLGHHPDWVAIAIANNLRRALGTAELDAGSVQMAFDQLQPANQSLHGTASWYGPYFHGRITATGETFNQYDMTAAHKTLAFGTRLKVRNVNNDRTVVVRINDRGPYIGDRSLDLSKAAAQCLDGEHVGLVTYEALILQDAAALADADALAMSPAFDHN